MGCVWYQNADLNLKFKDPSFPYGWGGVAMPKRAKRAKRAKSVFFFFRVSGIMSIHLFFFILPFFYLYVLSTYLQCYWINLFFFFRN